MLEPVVTDFTLKFLNRSSAFTAVIALIFLRCGTNPSLEQGEPYGMAERVQWTTSRIIGSPDPVPPYELRRVFPQFTFENPVFIAQDPLSDRLLVAEYGGRIVLPKSPVTCFHPYENYPVNGSCRIGYRVWVSQTRNH